jgi:hypothetical protein
VQKVCPGFLNIAGHGSVSLVNTNWNTPTDLASPVKVEGGNKVIVDLKGRTYISNRCSPGYFDNEEYATIRLLGKRMRYTVDLSSLGCGCNAAFYLTNMRQNYNKTSCGDFYCDAMSVCGVACMEVDIQEANKRAWASTMHMPDDAPGVSMGYGGGTNYTGRRDWDSSQYGPGGACIDTTAAPVDVTVDFPVARNGSFMGMVITLGQAGHNCKLSSRIRRYHLDGRDALSAVADALQAGMTPVISYWSSKEMLWMDGKGDDELGPCAEDFPRSCPESVSFYNFAIEPSLALEPEEVDEPAVEPAEATAPEPPWEPKKPTLSQLLVPKSLAPLQATPQFHLVELGACSDHGWSPIIDKATCEAAAPKLQLPDKTAMRVTHTPVTQGCFYIPALYTLYLATDPANAGNGADGYRQQLCTDEAMGADSNYAHIVFSSKTTSSPPPTTTTAFSHGTDARFDCSHGLSNWKALWTIQKALWCCQHERLGCLPTWYNHSSR